MGDTKNNMKINNSTIFLKDIRCYAYHGVAPQENLIGNEYVIDLKLKVDISKAAQTDEVTDTVNYAEVHNVIKTEMAIPSKLLEHAGGRIVQKLSRHFLILRKWSFAFLSGIHLWEQTLMPQALSCIVVENKRVSSLGYPTNYILSAINLPEVSISSSFFYSQIPQPPSRQAYSRNVSYNRNSRDEYVRNQDP